MFSAFNPFKYTHGAMQPTLRRPGSSWGFGALLKGLTSVVDNSCRSRDSNPQPRVTSPTLYPLGHDRPLCCLRQRQQASFGLWELSAALHRTCSRRMSPKKCVFGCEGKITLFIFPNKPALREPWIQEWSFTTVFVCSHHFGDECFINKAQFEVEFAYCLKLKDGAVPVIKRSRSWVRTAGGN